MLPAKYQRKKQREIFHLFLKQDAGALFISCSGEEFFNNPALSYSRHLLSC
jgi:hypothetical protein